MQGNYFLDLEDGDQFVLRLQEDPIAGVGAEGLRVYKPHRPLAGQLTETVELDEHSIKQSNRAVSLLTKELKAIKPIELNSVEAKDLLERRDLEDILFS